MVLIERVDLCQTHCKQVPDFSRAPGSDKLIHIASPKFLPSGQYGLCFGYCFSGPLPLRAHHGHLRSILALKLSVAHLFTYGWHPQYILLIDYGRQVYYRLLPFKIDCMFCVNGHIGFYFLIPHKKTRGGTMVWSKFSVQNRLQSAPLIGFWKNPDTTHKILNGLNCCSISLSHLL